jgi:hypothetical protein
MNEGTPLGVKSKISRYGCSAVNGPHNGTLPLPFPDVSGTNTLKMGTELVPETLGKPSYLDAAVWPRKSSMNHAESIYEVLQEKFH